MLTTATTPTATASTTSTAAERLPGVGVARAAPQAPARLRLATVALGLVPVLWLVPRLARRSAVPWTVAVGCALLGCLFFASWFSCYGFVRRWNCILMRDHEIVQQPMREDRVASLLLKDAVGFIDRWVLLSGPGPRATVSLLHHRGWGHPEGTGLCVCTWHFRYSEVSLP